MDHGPVNSVFGACGELPSPLEVPILPYAVWQCGQYEELSDAFTLMEFDFSHPIATMEGVTEAAVRRSGLRHGVVLWMDWSLDQDGRFSLSTAPEGGKPTHLLENFFDVLSRLVSRVFDENLILRHPPQCTSSQ